MQHLSLVALLAAISKWRKIFSFCKFSGRLDEKRAAGDSSTNTAIQGYSESQEYLRKNFLKVRPFLHTTDRLNVPSDPEKSTPV